jgi:uncharacterized protein (DUF1330 family)
MPAYFIARVTITDPEKWKTYVAAVPATVRQFGGRTLARSSAVETLEGQTYPHQMVVIEFPNIDTVRQWWDSPQYREVLKLREGAAILDAWTLPGL